MHRGWAFPTLFFVFAPVMAEYQYQSAANTIVQLRCWFVFWLNWFVWVLAHRKALRADRVMAGSITQPCLQQSGGEPCAAEHIARFALAAPQAP